MFEMYEQYGDVCAFDVTYNIIKQRSLSNRQWGVGLFSGLDCNLRLTIFAVALISK
jgi:hypothetical protein